MVPLLHGGLDDLAISWSQGLEGSTPCALHWRACERGLRCLAQAGGGSVTGVSGCEIEPRNSFVVMLPGV